ncbi:MAG: ErfK/YbiS/YcfS/YnhG family protein [Chloroflexi bacterium]|nr:ErfK/YbiS/YcfS/YnhG family protein [Chloroflexota bacterium]
MTFPRLSRLLAFTMLLFPAFAQVPAAGAVAVSARVRQIPPDLLATSYLVRLPDSGHVRFVRASADGSLLFVGLSAGGIARSADGGRTWKTLSSGVAGSPGAQMLDLQISPSNPKIVWATGLTGVYHSTDAGLTWTEADVRTDVPGRAIGSVLSLDPRHPEAAYLAGYRNGGLYRTGDGGLTWQRVLPYPVSAVAVEPANGATIYAVSRTAGFQRSTDHGHSWTTGVSLPAYAGIGEETAAPGRLLAVDGAAGGLFVALDGGGMVRSIDGGRTWIDFSIGLPRSVSGNGYAVPYSMTVTSGSVRRIYAIVPSGVLGAAAGGALFSALLATDTVSGTTGISSTPQAATPSPITGTQTMSATPTTQSTSQQGWQAVNSGVDAVTPLTAAQTGVLVASEGAPNGGYPAVVSTLNGPPLYNVPYVLPPPLARVTATGFAYGLTLVKYLSGVNYEGPNDRPWQLWQDKKFDPTLVAVDFDNAAAAGYRVIRVFVQDPLPAQVLAGQFGHIDDMATLARQRDLRLLITFNDSKDPNMGRVAAVDRAIAAHYAGNPTIFGYDLQNEPAFQDIAGVIYPPGQTLPLLSDAIIKRYGEHVKLSRIHADRSAGKWRDGPFAHMSERQIYQYLNAASILNDYFTANPNAADQAPGGHWGPLLAAVNASLSMYLHTQIDAVRSVDRSHVITVGYNNAFWASRPANDVLDFRSIHLYPTTQNFNSIHDSLHTFESLLSGGHTPQVLEEYGFSTAFQSSGVASVQETGMSLYMRVLGGSGDFKWQLNDDTVGFNPVENGLGLFGARNAAKVGFYINRELAAYFSSPHKPGGVRMWSDGAVGLGYLYSAPDALGVSGGSYSDVRITYTAHNKAASAQLWLDWTQPGRLRLVSSHEADLTIDLAALTGAVTGTVTLAPSQQVSVSGLNVRLHMQAGIWYTLSYTPGGLALQPIGLPRPVQTAGWYILATGHNVSPPFLSQWLTLGGVPTLGAPLDEAQPSPGGAVQYFTSVAMQAHGTSAGLRPLGLAELGSKADPPAKELPKQQRHLYVSATGHNISGAFLDYWQRTGGIGFWGPPLTEQRKKGGATVQYFANAEFVWNGSSMSLGPLGARAWARLHP